jgi:hypothetical protein
MTMKKLHALFEKRRRLFHRLDDQMLTDEERADIFKRMDAITEKMIKITMDAVKKETRKSKD